MPEENKPSAPSPTPWSMQWVALAIVAFIVLYTAINLLFRKDEPPFLPFEESQRQREQVREDWVFGWRKLPVETVLGSYPETETWPEIPPGEDIGGEVEAWLPRELMMVIPRRPALAPLGGSVVHAPSVLAAGAPLKVVLTGSTAPTALRLEAYEKDGQLFLFLEEESSRSRRDSSRMENGSAFFRLREGLPGEGTLQVQLHSLGQVHQWEIHIHGATQAVPDS